MAYIEAKADKGYHFTRWSDGDTNRKRGIAMTSNLELTPTFEVGDPEHIYEGELYIANWDSNPKIQLEFGSRVPKPGDKLRFTLDWQTNDFYVVFDAAKWDATKVTPTTNDKIKEIVLTSDMISWLESQDNWITINANNAKLWYVDIWQDIRRTVSVEAGANGSVSIEGQSGTSAELSDGANVTIKATPVEHYKFVSWSKGGNVVSGAGATYNFTLSEATAGTYTATFAEAQKYTITVSAGDNGSVDTTTGGEYYEGTQVTFTATPADGYRVARWTKNGTTIAGETKNTLTITVGGNDRYGVEFEEKPAGPEEIELSYSDKKLYLATITNAGANDDDIIRFYITNSSGEGRNGWGIGEIQDMNWSKQGVSWTGKEGTSWTYEYTVSQVKGFANGTTGIQYNIYNACDVAKITLVKQ